MTRCQYCGTELYFSDQHRSSSGKYIPMEKGTSLPHECKGRPFKLTRCYNCRALIYFSDNIRSPAGRMIPVYYDTDQPHECSDKERDWQQDQASRRS